MAYISPKKQWLTIVVLILASGWQGAPSEDAPGFPKDGSWTVNWEGVKPFLS